MKFPPPRRFVALLLDVHPCPQVASSRALRSGTNLTWTCPVSSRPPLAGWAPGTEGGRVGPRHLLVGAQGSRFFARRSSIARLKAAVSPGLLFKQILPTRLGRPTTSGKAPSRRIAPASARTPMSPIKLRSRTTKRVRPKASSAAADASAAAPVSPMMLLERLNLQSRLSAPHLTAVVRRGKRRDHSDVSIRCATYKRSKDG